LTPWGVCRAVCGPASCLSQRRLFYSFFFFRPAKRPWYCMYLDNTTTTATTLTAPDPDPPSHLGLPYPAVTIYRPVVLSRRLHTRTPDRHIGPSACSPAASVLSKRSALVLTPQRFLTLGSCSESLPPFVALPHLVSLGRVATASAWRFSSHPRSRALEAHTNVPPETLACISHTLRHA